MKNLTILTLIFASLLAVSGCGKCTKKETSENEKQQEKKEEKKIPIATLVAKYTDKPVVVDGKLDDACWKTAAVYKLGLSADKLAKDMKLKEGGEVRFAWDDKYLYLAVSFEDNDIVAEGKQDGLHHYKMGDLCELFLKPENKSWYWELYVTPRGNKTTFFYPSKGYLGLPSGFEYQCDLTVAAQVDGTLNDWSDKDRKWTAEMAVPLAELTKRGETFGEGSLWRVLIGRYNYSYYFDGKELSMAPQLPLTSYHLTENYGILKLEK
ncbi:MAG: carbohydrate-binding family 9-like protein [Phycisphaerae bacterium]|nr:carbohydrate-binding family 9-like protein [Phycisphaerae bacterium]